MSNITKTELILYDLKNILEQSKLIEKTEVDFRNIPLENIEIVIAALEKYCKKKVVITYAYTPYSVGEYKYDGKCPSCGATITYKRMIHCPYCGQQLNWRSSIDEFWDKKRI